MSLPEKTSNNKADPIAVSIGHTSALAAVLATHDGLLDHHPTQVLAVLGLLANTAANAESAYSSKAG